MSIFVRPTKSIKYIKPKKSQTVRNSSKSKNNRWILIGSIIGILLVILGVGDWLLIRSETYRMQVIEVRHSTPVPYIQLADDDIVAQIKGKHYYLTKYSSTLSKLISTHHPVATLDLESTDQSGIYQLIIGYKQVDMVIRFQDIDYGLVGDQLYPIQSSISGLVLNIPSYNTGMTLSGLFYQVPAEQLNKQYQTIILGLQSQNIQRITYHVAPHQIQVNTTTQEIYFNISGNIFEQLKKYRSLSTNKKDIPFQRIIDLGAIEDGVFVYP